MTEGHFTEIPCDPNTTNRPKESHIFGKIDPVLTTLCMLDLKFLELFCVFL